MAHPRRIIPAQTYLLSRRCYQRTFRLRPCAETNRIFLYCLAFAAEKTGIVVHAACVMSNHLHLVVTDPRGKLPDFLREFHRLSAKAMNASQGQWENLWAAEATNVVRLVTDEDVEDKIAYVVANPVAAGLVETPEEWPGLLLWGERTLHATRPSSYFREEGTCPAMLTLPVRPPRMVDGSTSVKRGGLSRAIAARVAQARRMLASQGRRFLGRVAVLRASFGQRAHSYEQRFGMAPTFAAKARAVRDQLRRIERHFRLCYRAALKEWREGKRCVSFPFGTWGKVVFDGASVDARPAADR